MEIDTFQKLKKKNIFSEKFSDSSLFIIPMQPNLFQCVGFVSAIRALRDCCAEATGINPRNAETWIIAALRDRKFFTVRERPFYAAFHQRVLLS